MFNLLIKSIKISGRFSTRSWQEQNRCTNCFHWLNPEKFCAINKHTKASCISPSILWWSIRSKSLVSKCSLGSYHHDIRSWASRWPAMTCLDSIVSLLVLKHPWEKIVVGQKLWIPCLLLSQWIVPSACLWLVWYLDPSEHLVNGTLCHCWEAHVEPILVWYIQSTFAIVDNK